MRGSPLFVLLILAACGGQVRFGPDAGGGQARFGPDAGGGEVRFGPDAGGGQAAVCTWPAGADTYDAATHAGCSPSAAFNICEVPNGSTVEADGGVVLPDGGPGNMTCTDACTSADFALSCYSRELRGPIPDPPASLTCRPIAVPTPSNALFYCCACAH